MSRPLSVYCHMRDQVYRNILHLRALPIIFVFPALVLMAVDFKRYSSSGRTDDSYPLNIVSLVILPLIILWALAWSTIFRRPQYQLRLAILAGIDFFCSTSLTGLGSTVLSMRITDHTCARYVGSGCSARTMNLMRGAGALMIIAAPIHQMLMSSSLHYIMLRWRRQRKQRQLQQQKQEPHDHSPPEPILQDPERQQDLDSARWPYEELRDPRPDQNGSQQKKQQQQHVPVHLKKMHASVATMATDKTNGTLVA